MRVNATAPGEKATLEIMRDGKPMNVNVTIGSASSATVAKNGEAAPEGSHLGMALRPLTPDERSQAGVSGGLGRRGVERSCGRGGHPGGRRRAVGQRHAGQQRRAAARSRARADSQVALLIQRGDTRIFVPVGLG